MKKLWIAICVMSALVIAAAAINFYMATPKELTINSGETIEVYTDEQMVLDVSADGLTDEDISKIEWTASNDCISIDDGVMTASYDGEHMEYNATVSASLHNGLKTWKGTAQVVVILKAEEIESGKMIKTPSGAQDSYMSITGSPSANMYLYFKCNTDASKDFSFILGSGKTEIVYVPCEEYTMYFAKGNQWYGAGEMFGPQTLCYKNDSTMKFTSTSYWTLKMYDLEGNSSSTAVPSNEFPR